MAKSYDRDSYSSRASKSSRSRRRDSGSAPQTGANPRTGAQPGAFRSAVDSASSHAPSSSDYSRRSYRPDYSKQRNQRKRRKILVVSLLVVLVLVLGGAGAAFAYINGIQSNMQDEVSDEMRVILADKSAPGEPFYMVLMGTDKSEWRDSQAEFEGDSYRTDSIMLMRVDPQNKKVSLVSLMRDTMVDMGVNGMQKLNSAYSLGGAEYTVQVVSELAGVPISHYAEIDFDGFCDIVDALGGIEVDVPVEIDDPEAGGYLAAGEQTLDGEQALILCRSRHAYDNIGTGKGDEYRAANQRMVIGAIAQKVLASDLPTMMSTVEALSKHVTTDMSVTDILALANNMRGMDMSADFYTAVNPTTSQMIDGIWWEVMNETAWRTMISRIDQGLPPVEEDKVDEETGMVMASSGGGAAEAAASSSGTVKRSGTVSVRNGTEITGAASSAQTKIAALGYTIDVGNANSTDYAQTIVVYNTADQAELAAEIASTLGVGTTVQNTGEYLFESDYLVVIGSDWQ